MSDSLFGEPIMVYLSEEAVEDGFLFDVTKIEPSWGNGPFRFVTTNLLNELGYMEGDKIKIPCLIDLMKQSVLIIKNKKDDFYSGEIETPAGSKVKIFIVLNELNKFTLMLPGDY